MQMANSAATPDRGNGMGHLRAYRAAVGGKHPDNKTGLTTGTGAGIGRLIIAIGTLLLASVSGSASYAQSGPFAGMAGNWSGGGTLTLDDGSSERIRCRAAYAVGAGGARPQPSLPRPRPTLQFSLPTQLGRPANPPSPPRGPSTPRP